MRFRPSPFVVLAGLLVLLTGSLVVEQAVSRRQAELLLARGAYAGALAETRTLLAGLLGRAAGDKTLAQHLGWRLTHSVQSTLEARLQKGSLDQLVLLDAGCQELGRARVGRALALPCPFANGDAAAKADEFFWLESEGVPVLGLVRPVPAGAGGDVHAVGLVALDAEWLAQHAGLKRRMEALSLAQGDPKTGALVASGKLNSVYSRVLGPGAGDGVYHMPLVWPSIAGIFICLAVGMGRERTRRAKETLARKDLVGWCRGLLPRTPVGTDGEDLGTARLLVTQALKLKSEVVQTLTAHKQALEGLVRQRDDELAKHRQRLAELAELDSLAVQLSRTTQAFLERMQRFHGQAEDLSDLLESGLGAQSRDLLATLRAWQTGVSERGARKFLRGLSETPGAVEGRSELDEQLDRLAAVASAMEDQSRGGMRLARALVDTATFASRLAGLWRGIALKTHADGPAVSLLEPLAEAQGLVALEGVHDSLDFSNLMTDGEAERIPVLPRTVWITALYHVYVAMAELAQGTKAVVATRLRQDGDKTLLIIQAAAAPDAAPLPKRSENQAWHLEVSRAILAPFQVTLIALPSLDGPFPVAIAWLRESATAARVKPVAAVQSLEG